ncbi:MAG: AAA family ATPase [Pseudomonadota bacterium]
MYLDHFGLTQMPFTLTPDTSFFMSRAGHQDALNVLLVALRSGEGFVKVTGEVGTGKTMLCRTLINQLEDEFEVAYLPNPYLRPTTLLLSIADELNIDYPERIGQHAFTRLLHQKLLNFHTAGRRVLVCLDEAQAIPIETLETLRLLTNLETEKTKLIQVVLFGQPELDEVLQNESIRQLRQRITFSYQLAPLSRVASRAYVTHRLSVAGARGVPLFSERAIDTLFNASRGIPRVINILAHKALMVAFGEGALRVERKHLRAAVADTVDARRCHEQEARAERRRRWVFGGLGLAGLSALLGLSIFFADVMAVIQ